jgi:hypothetical protein
VAVHKFGPVPVFLLPEKEYPYTTELDGKIIQLRIGVHANWDGANAESQRSLFGSDIELIDAVSADFDLSMGRYLEDVAEIFADIENHADLRRAYELAKAAEEVIGASMKTKLDACLPDAQRKSRSKKNPNAPQHYDEWMDYRQAKSAAKNQRNLIHHWSEDRRVACEFYSENWESAVRAEYARAVALYLLNELYALLGVATKSYGDTLRELKIRVERWHGKGAYEQALDSDPGFSALREALQSYRRRDDFALEQIPAEGASWQDGFIRFTQFLHYLRLFGPLPPHQPRVFVSYNHGVPVAEKLKEQVTHWLEAKAYPHKVRVLSLEERYDPAPFRQRIKAGIWLSDHLLAIVPKGGSALGGAKKHYEWIAREAEHALLLGKPVTYLTEHGTNLADLRACLLPGGERSVDQFREQDQSLDILAPKARTAHGRALRLDRHFTVHPWVEFHLPSAHADHLEGRVIGALEKISRLCVDDRHRQMLRGWFSLFSDAQRQILASVNRMGLEPKGRGQIVQAARLTHDSLTESVATAAFTQAKSRTLAPSLPQRPDDVYRIIVEAAYRKYLGGLRHLLADLRPDLDAEMLNSLLDATIVDLENLH